MIVLLDLNYTLVENSEEKRRPYIEQIAGERYRRWLVELLQDYAVCLVTARPEKYRAATLASINSEMRWQPDGAFFNDLNLPPPVLKERILVDRLLPMHPAETFRALESNPRTRAMYERYNVRSMPVTRGEEAVRRFLDG